MLSYAFPKSLDLKVFKGVAEEGEVGGAAEAPTPAQAPAPAPAASPTAALDSLSLSVA